MIKNVYLVIRGVGAQNHMCLPMPEPDANNIIDKWIKGLYKDGIIHGKGAGGFWAVKANDISLMHTSDINSVQMEGGKPNPISHSHQGNWGSGLN